VTQVYIESKNELYPTQYEIQVSKQFEEPFTWQTLKTVTQPAGKSTMMAWHDLTGHPKDQQSFVSAFRIVCLEHNTGQNQYSIHKVLIYGYGGPSYAHSRRDLVEEEELQVPQSVPPSILLTKDLSDHQYYDQDHRQLQGIVIAGEGIATLKFPGSGRSRRNLRKGEPNRDLQEEPSPGLGGDGRPFGIMIQDVVPLPPYGTLSSAPSHRRGGILVSVTLALLTFALGMAL
jgi:hypothetical protein